jgi:uncharacterized protein YjaZ
MSSIKFYIANATGEFDRAYIEKIEACYVAAEDVITKKLNATKIDIIFVNAPMNIISEIGIGGFAPGPHNIYISLDPQINKWFQKDMIMSIAHEAHHCMRWRDPGYGDNVGEEMISEGMATLFEEEVAAETPVYAKVKIKPEEIEEVKKHLNDKSKYAGHQKWFFGADDIQRWFGYTYGYQLCKAYSNKTGKTAAELVNTNASEMLP